MTKVRDRYQSGFDETVPGVRSAVYDIGLALYMLKEIAEKHELMGERFTFSSGDSWTVAQILEIAKVALMTSVSPAAWIYERLQQNEEAARLLEQVLEDKSWSAYRHALSRTLDNQALVSRGWVTSARREIERRKAKKGQGGAA